MEPTPIEATESVDMMRILEHEMKIRMVPIGHETRAVDTPEDLSRVEQLIPQM